MGAVLLGAVLGVVLVVLGAVFLGVVFLGVVFQSLEPESSSHSRRQVLLHGQAIKVRCVWSQTRRLHTDNRHTHLYLD